MRLLEFNNDGEFSLTKDFIGVEIPEYAVLSHTWGSDEEEVTYRDMIDGTGKNKVGYEKIRFCRKQARRDGLYNFWETLVVLTNRATASLRKLLTPCFAGIAKRQNATYI